MLKILRKYKRSCCLFSLLLLKFGTIQPIGSLFLALYNWYQIKNLRADRIRPGIVGITGQRNLSTRAQQRAAILLHGAASQIGEGLVDGMQRRMPILGTLSNTDLTQASNMLLASLLAQVKATIADEKKHFLDALDRDNAQYLAELDEEVGGTNGPDRLHILKKRAQVFIDETIENSFKKMAATLHSLTFQEDGELSPALKKSIEKASKEMKKELVASINSPEFQQSITNAGNHFVEHVGDVVHSKFKKIALTTVLSAVAIIVSWYGLKLLYNQIDRKLNQPRIIIESSFKSTFERIKNFIFKKNVNFRPMVFSHELEERIINIIETTQNINSKIKEGKTNVKYRNLFLFGAPGTGKTMFARELAKRSGMDYAMIAGSSFFRNDAGIREMDELFSYANNSKNGFILIVDEADSLLIERSTLKPQSKPHQILTHWLDYTGTRNNKYMIVYCTNHKSNLDSAMKRRVDDYIEIPLPKEDERFKVLWLYREQILFDIKQNGLEFVEAASQSLNDKKIWEIVKKTEGLSNGDLEGIINNIKTDADVTSSGFVDNDLIDRVVDQAVAKSTALQVTQPNCSSS